MPLRDRDDSCLSIGGVVIVRHVVAHVQHRRTVQSRDPHGRLNRQLRILNHTATRVPAHLALTTQRRRHKQPHTQKQQRFSHRSASFLPHGFRYPSAPARTSTVDSKCQIIAGSVNPEREKTDFSSHHDTNSFRPPPLPRPARRTRRIRNPPRPSEAPHPQNDRNRLARKPSGDYNSPMV